MVTYTYRTCDEVKKWRCPAECATEQYKYHKCHKLKGKNQNIHTIYNLYSKKGTFFKKKIGWHEKYDQINSKRHINK